MIVIGRIDKGAYFDSVTLMTVGKAIAEMEGIVDAAVVMGSKENREILRASGLLTKEASAAGDTDLIISIKADDDDAARVALESVADRLEDARGGTDTESVYQPASIEGALEIAPETKLALISVAGRYAGGEASKALNAGLHVMIFSDNVSIENEIGLKKQAQERGLLVMGPDCGSAIINGVPLAFANVVKRGDIGIVSASGTGLQEVSSIISNEGAGVSQAIGVGGRDVTSAVGGIMFLEAFASLIEDDNTKVIVLISKPPDEEVLDRIKMVIEGVDKPIVSIFLGADCELPGSVTTLEQAALHSVALSQGRDGGDVNRFLSSRENWISTMAEREATRRSAGRKYVRGLMSGGTFCAEAQVILAGMISDVYSNAPTGNSARLDNSLKSIKNTVVDLGADEFTVGRPHPMIDYSLRLKRIAQESEDPETAVILLDVVLGYGSAADPGSELEGVIEDACKNVAVVCSITGTAHDPQNRDLVEKTLKDAGAITMPSNAAASLLAGSIARLRRVG